MRLLNLNPILSEEQASELAGFHLGPESIRYLIREDTEVRDENGTVLIRFLRRILPREVCERAYPAIKDSAVPSHNRGNAGGNLKLEGKINSMQPRYRRKGSIVSGARIIPVKANGMMSQTNYAIPVESGIIGYFDRNARFPFCRQTSYSLAHPDRFLEAIPFIKAVDSVFSSNAPERYSVQKALVDKTSQDFVIQGTAFTTVTVNRNWQTAVHQDKGDLKEGFGVMSVLEYGKYTGGFLVFPKYGVAVDMRQGDVCLADVHQWHGNTPIIGIPNGYERISCVFYYRENMQYCGTIEQEREFAKNRTPGSEVNKADNR